LPIDEPFAEGYERQLRWLRDEMDVDAVITGDIAAVNAKPNWMRERSRPVGIDVHTPLWGRERGELLRRVLDRGFEACFSCVDTRSLPQEWVGRKLNRSALEELGQMGIDLCGEQGEYHTLVTDSPQFERAIRIRSYSRRRTDSLAYMEIHEAALAA
jgi:uncharacterized protein (TIGR00290 family)